MSQALFGGLVSSACSRNTNMRQSFVFGAIGGSLPDLDAWAGAVVGPLQERLWHRGPTHSLLVLGCVGLCIWATDKRLTSAWTQKLKYLWFGAFTHPLLDILTGFETSWGYPLFEPSALGWFPVMEPVSLIILLIASVGCLLGRQRRLARAGLLGLGLWVGMIGSHHRWVFSLVSDVEAPDNTVERVVVRPMLASFLTYRVVWMGASDCYVAGLQPLNGSFRWSGVTKLARVVASSDFPNKLLEQGCFIEVNEREIGDLRFALTPESPSPLWLWSKTDSEWIRRAERQLSPELKAKFLNLWRGERQVGWTSTPRLVEP